MPRTTSPGYFRSTCAFLLMVAAVSFQSNATAGESVLPVGYQQTAGWGGSSTLGEPIRSHQIYPAAGFPNTTVAITTVSWRRSDPTVFTDESGEFTIKMSTTEKNEVTLSRTFAENIGADETIVFDGTWVVSSSSTGTSPYPFEITLNLSTPFVYNPSEGNLLLDIFCAYSSIPRVDAVGGLGDGVARVFTLSDPGEPSGFKDLGGDIIQIEYDYLESIWAEPRGGIFTNTVEVSLYSGVEGSTLRYTTDGLEPTAESPAFVEALNFNDDTTLKAQLFVNGQQASEVYTEVYTKFVPPEIEFTPGGGFFTNSVSVELENKVGAGVIRYTLDGSEPTDTSTPLVGSILLDAATTITARVFVNQFPVSQIYSETYQRVYAFEDDGVPFAWRETHFGPDFLTNPDAAAEADPDGDFYTNREEYEQGTIPIDGDSAPTIELVIGTVPKLTFTTLPGREYRILRATDVNEPEWIAIESSIVAAGTELLYIDADAPENSFYQIELVTE